MKNPPKRVVAVVIMQILAFKSSLQMKPYKIFFALCAALLLAVSTSLVWLSRNDVNAKLTNRLGSAEILLIGDSITAGGGTWDWRIGTLFKTANFGQGSAGIRVISWIAEVRAIPSQKFKVVSVMAGANDAPQAIASPLSFNGDVAKATDAYIELINLLQRSGVEKIIITSTPPQANIEKNDFIKRLNANLIRHIEKSACCHYIDLWPKISDGKAILPRMTTDGVHFSDEAYDVWAAELKKLL